MANEDNTSQVNADSQVLSEVLSTVRELSFRYTNQEERIGTIEQIIMARLNDTRPFEHQMMARINELATTQTAVLEALATVREEQTAMREEQAAMRTDFNQFRQETSLNFRALNKKLAILNEDFLNNRTDYALLEKRVDDIETRAA